MNPAAPTAVPLDTGRIGTGRPRPARVYLWRRLLVAAVAACVLWGSLWGVFRLGGLLGTHVIAPALGTAPVPVAEAAQAAR